MYTNKKTEKKKHKTNKCLYTAVGPVRAKLALKNTPRDEKESICFGGGNTVILSYVPGPGILSGFL